MKEETEIMVFKCLSDVSFVLGSIEAENELSDANLDYEVEKLKAAKNRLKDLLEAEA